jgi:uncharacterized protein YdeI (YjbR/CyaY-like superfamily)
MKQLAYIQEAAPFAQPILHYIQELVIKACPEAEVKIKWSFPCFLYKGKILCSMAAFKQHCSFGFWLTEQLKDPNGYLLPNNDTTAMGNLGRITSVADIPDEAVMIDFIQQAMALIDNGATLTRKKNAAPKPFVVPEELEIALHSSPKARSTFLGFSTSHKREYSQWIMEAKTAATKEKRVAQAIEMMEEGKSRNWKYAK